MTETSSIEKVTITGKGLEHAIELGPDELARLANLRNLAAFGLMNREYRCQVMKVSVPRHVDKDSGFIDQSVDMLFALQVAPTDLEANGLLPAAYEWDEIGGCHRAAPGDLVKFSQKDKDYFIEIGDRETDDPDGEVKWRELMPAQLFLTGVVPDEDKETASPGAEVLILARRLPFYLAGELWYPNMYLLRFKDKPVTAESQQDEESSKPAKPLPLDEYLPKNAEEE